MIGSCIVDLQARLFRVPLDEVLSDAKHGDHTHFELVTVTIAQADGTVHYFDDPGCLFAWQRAGGEAATVWFHHSHEPRWLAADEVAFVPAGASPMGFGLAAVDRGASPAMTVAEAQAHLAAAAAAAAGGGDATH